MKTIALNHGGFTRQGRLGLDVDIDEAPLQVKLRLWTSFAMNITSSMLSCRPSCKQKDMRPRYSKATFGQKAESIRKQHYTSQAHARILMGKINSLVDCVWHI